MDISLIATDLDGTLLTSGGKIAPAARDSIRAARRTGVRVILSTTRNRDDVEDFADELGIADPIICSNGTQVFDSPRGRLLSEKEVPIDIVCALADLADGMDWGMATTVGDTTYYRQLPGQSLGRIFKNDLVVARNADGAKGGALRILVWEAEAIAAFRKTCEAQFGDVCYTTTFYSSSGAAKSLGVFPLGADKGFALATVLEELGIRSDRVMAVGDNENDIPMFRESGLKVAVANATESLKAIADVIAPSNDEDGVAWAIRKYALG